MKKKTVLIDLDGVLNVYNGNYDPNIIPSIKPGAKEFLEKLSADFIVKIFTTRNLLLTSKWVINNNLDKYISDVTNIKEPSYLIIDDRAITFKGDFEIVYKAVRNFNVWYK